jgi:hypothetical protein
VCVEKALEGAPALWGVPEGHEIMSSVSRQFKANWDNPSSIQAIYKVTSPKPAVDAYTKIRKDLRGPVRKLSGQQDPGIEVKNRWFGARRACKLGESDSDLRFCEEAGCEICKVLKESFGMASGVDVSTYRTCEMASASDQDVSQSEGSKSKAMLMTSVVFKLMPGGYNPARGHRTFENDKLVAILPSYLVIYNSNNTS